MKTLKLEKIFGIMMIAVMLISPIQPVLAASAMNRTATGSKTTLNVDFVVAEIAASVSKGLQALRESTHLAFLFGAAQNADDAGAQSQMGSSPRVMDRAQKAASVVYDIGGAYAYIETYGQAYTNADACYVWTDGTDTSCSYFDGAYGADGFHYLNQVVRAGGAAIPADANQAEAFSDWLLGHGWVAGERADVNIGDFVLLGTDDCWGLGGVVRGIDSGDVLLSTHGQVFWDGGNPVTTNPDVRLSEISQTSCGAVNKHLYLHYDRAEETQLFIPLVYENAQDGADVSFAGLEITIPADWVQLPPAESADIQPAYELSTTLVNAHDGSTLTVSASQVTGFTQSLFGFYEINGSDVHRQDYLVNEQLHAAMQLTYVAHEKSTNSEVFAAFRVGETSYGMHFLSPGGSKNSSDQFINILQGVKASEARFAFPQPVAEVDVPEKGSVQPSGYGIRAVAYDRAAVMNYRAAFGSAFDNDDDCYLWNDGSMLRCFLTTGAWGEDGAHYLARAARSGGIPLPNTVTDPAVKTIEGLRNFLLSHGGVEVANRQDLLPGDFIFLGRNGCYGWGGLVWTYQGTEPIMSMHSAVNWSSGAPITTNPQNMHVSDVHRTSCGEGVNEYSYVHIDSTQDQPAPKLTQSPTFSPATPFEGQVVQGSFRVCNYSTWTAFDTNSSYIRVPAGVNFPSVDLPALAKGNPGGCYTYTQSRAAFPASGYYSAEAGYLNPGWVKYLTTSGAINPVSLYVASLADIQLQGEITLAPADVYLNQQTSVTFTVKNVGPGTPVDNFRVAVYDEHYPANPPVAVFDESGNISLAPAANYTYTKNRAFSTPGIYYVIGEHYGNGAWVPVYGDSVKLLRVLYPQPPKPQLAKGMPPWIALAGEPVNTGTGNFVHTFTDVVIPLPGMAFDLTRYYNHVDAAETPSALGYGWSWQLDWRLSWRSDKSAVLQYPDGREAYFLSALSSMDPFHDMSGTYVGLNAETETLERAVDGSAVMHTVDHVAYRFDAAGRLVSVRDENGNGFDLQHDAGGLLVQVDHTNGDVFTFAYQAGYLTTITLPDGNAVTFSHTAAGDLETVTDINGDVLRYVYDDQHRITEFYDSAGKRVVLNEYNADNQVWRQTDVDGNLTSFDYAALTRQTTFYDELNHPTTYTYDIDLRVVAIEDARGGITQYQYDAKYNRTGKTDAENNTWLWTYDGRGRLTAASNPLGATWTYVYDVNGDLVQKAGALSGQITQYQYDSQHNLVAVTDAEGGITSRAYDSAGLLIEETNPNGAVVRFEHNALGLVTAIIEETAQGDLTTRFAYDELGRKTSMTDALGNTTQYEYNLDHQVTRISGPSGYAVAFSYDDNGNLLQETDSLGFTKTYAYDEKDRLLRVSDWQGNTWQYDYLLTGWLESSIDPLGYSTSYAYDETGNMTGMTDQNGDTWTYTYDLLGRQTASLDPLGNETYFDFDASGSLTEKNQPCSTCTGGRAVETIAYNLDGTTQSYTDARGAQTSFAYDKTGRQIEVLDAEGHATRYTWDAGGRLLAITDALGQQTEYIYNEVGWLSSVTDPLGRQVTYTHDLTGNLTALTDPNGNTTTYTYNTASQMTSQTNALGETTQFSYDLRGNLLALLTADGARTSFAYDANDRLIRVTNPNGFATTYTYDGRGQRVGVLDALGGLYQVQYTPVGQVAHEINPAGYQRRYDYDALGRLVALTDWEGQWTRLDYSTDGRQLSITDAVGAQTHFVYDANQNLTLMKDSLGFETSYQYNLLNQIVGKADALGNRWQQTYDAVGSLIALQTPNGATKRWEYDAARQLTGEIDPAGQAVTYAHDLNGNLLAATNRNGDATHFAYDSLNRLVALTDALGNVQHYDYDVAGNLESLVDALGNTTHFAYDATHNLVQVEDAMGGQTSYGYDALNRNTLLEDALGNQTVMTYDAVGNLTQVQLPEGQQVNYAYNGNGLRTAYTNARGYTSVYEYDAASRMIKESDPLGNSWYYAYNPRGDLIRAVDAEGHVTRYSYDPLGQLTSVTDALGYVTRYGYDVMGNLVQETDANGNSTRYAYDILNRLVQETNPLNATWQYQYDPEGNLERLVDAEGQRTQYAYDALNQVTAVLYVISGGRVDYAYDANGNLVEMTDGLGVSSFDYDALNRLSSKTDAFGRVVGYAYDALSRLTAMTYPDGDVVQQDYDANGWLTGITIPDGRQVNYAYNADGLPVSMMTPNQVETGWAYDEAGRLVGMAATRAGEPEPLLAVDYVLNGNGDQVQAFESLLVDGTEQTISKAFTYNDRGELTETFEGYASFAGKGVTTSYSYDPAGNRTAVSSNRMAAETTETTPAYYNAANQLLALGGTQYAYDMNGNRVRKTAADGTTTTYTYDQANRLTALQAELDGALLWQQANAYDGLGRRLVKTVETAANPTPQERQYVVDGFGYSQLAEYGAGGLDVQLYRGLDDTLLGAEGFAGGSSTGMSWLVVDGLGSSRAALDDGGAVIELNAYDAYGNGIGLDGLPALKTDSIADRYGLGGEEYDAADGLVYYGARYYDAEAGRWLSQDAYRGAAAAPLTRNRYQYTRNNPVNRGDVDGYFDFKTGAVQWGDTWESIATQWGIGVAELRQLNPWVNQPRVGDYLQLPECRTAQCQLAMGITAVRIGGVSGTLCAQRIMSQQREYQLRVQEARMEYQRITGEQLSTYLTLKQLQQMINDAENNIDKPVDGTSDNEADTTNDHDDLSNEEDNKSIIDYIDDVHNTILSTCDGMSGVELGVPEAEVMIGLACFVADYETWTGYTDKMSDWIGNEFSPWFFDGITNGFLGILHWMNDVQDDAPPARLDFWNKDFWTPN